MRNERIIWADANVQMCGKHTHTCTYIGAAKAKVLPLSFEPYLWLGLNMLLNLTIIIIDLFS